MTAITFTIITIIKYKVNIFAETASESFVIEDVINISKLRFGIASIFD